MTITARGLFEESTARIVTTQAGERSTEQTQRDIYESHRHRVFSLAFHMTGNELEAEQLLIESFVRAFEGNPKPDSATIDNALIEGLRARFSLVPDGAATMSEPAKMNGRNIRRTDLEEAIQRLPPCERLVFLLRDVEGYHAESISELMSMPAGEVARIVYSARIRLRCVLADMEAKRAA